MLYAIVGMLVIILDQGVKFWVTNHIMVDTVTEPLIPGVISLVRMHNDGAAFSFLAGGGARIPFIILTGVFTVAVIIMLVTGFISGRFGRWCLVLVTAGGLSNCLDRVLYGYVVDMFKVELFNFAVFNVADIFITVFCLLFIIYIIFGGEDEKEDLSEFDLDDEDDDRPSFKASLKDSRREAKADKAAAAMAKRDRKRGAKYEEDDYAPVSRREAKRSAKYEDDDYAPVSRREAKRSARFEDEEFAAQFAPKKRSAQAQPPQRSSRSGQSARVEEDRPSRSAKRKTRYEEEYEAFMASRPDAKAEMARKAAPAAQRNAQGDDPFAAWEKANAKAESRQYGSYTAKAMGVSRSAASAGEEPELQPVREAAPARRAAPAPERSAAVRPDAPAAAKPAPKPAPKAEESMEFSLDDILSEFR